MNRTSKMVTLFQEKILLRKKVDYQEECLLRMIKYKLFIKKKLLRKVQLIHTEKYFFELKTGRFSKRSSLLSLKTGLFQKEK